MTIAVYDWNQSRPQKVDKFTGPMPFYKIMREDCIHHGFQYKTGLNIDKIRFSPRGSCKPGGMYFTCRNILSYIDYGPYICKVTIPDGAKIYCEGGKFKANKFILGRKMRITSKVLIRLLEEGADLPSSYYQYLMRRIAIKERNCDLFEYTGINQPAWQKIFDTEDSDFVKEVLRRFGAEHLDFLRFIQHFCSKKIQKILDKWLKTLV